MWSYNNAGFCVLGRLVEVLLEKPYDAALRDHLIKPLGITHAATSPYEAVLFRTAVGHLETPGEGQHAAPIWALARSNGPAGSMFAMSARSLVSFARMHLEDGRAHDGTQVLAPGTPTRMQAHQVDLPDLGAFGSSWGLGFERFDQPEGAVVGHDGNTIGQAAYLRLVPEAGVALAVLTNGGEADRLFRDVAGHVLAELAARPLPPEPVPTADAPASDVSRLVGRYTCDMVTMIVSQEDDGSVWVDAIPEDDLSKELGEEPERFEIVARGEDTMVTRERRHGAHRVYAFLGDDGEGRAAYLHGGRAFARAHSGVRTGLCFRRWWTAERGRSAGR
jgi:hypothetical protein